MPKIFLLVLIFLGLGAPLISRPVSAAMSSASYRIPADGITFGGVEATSTSYGTFSSIGGPPAADTTSTSYIVKGGFLGGQEGALGMTVSAGSLSLGTLSTGLVSGAASVVTVSSTADTGYTLSIGSVSGSAIASVSDGSVTAGSTEYGISVSGNDAAFGNDQGISVGLVLASRSRPGTDVQTTLSFKAAIATGAPVGAYSQSITLSVAANF